MAKTAQDMDTIEAIHTRRSIREYQDKPISEELITEILRAAMAAPSARNQQSWEFVVITDPEIRKKIPVVSPFAQMVVDAPLAILVCGRKDLILFTDLPPLKILTVPVDSETVMATALV